MELSFNEVLILSVATEAQKPQRLAQEAARIYDSTKFDAMAAGPEIDTLVRRGFLSKSTTGLIQLTRQGQTALINALPVLDRLRYVAMATACRLM